MIRFAVPLVLCALAAFAQNDREDYRVELTGFAWRTSVQGTTQTNVVPIDFRNDLLLRGAWTFLGDMTWKVERRHRLLVEGAPFSYGGRAPLQRTIVYQGQSFTVQDVVVSQADLTYIYGGYGYDILRRESGHLGLTVGGAYLDAEGTIASETRALSATQHRRIGVPLIGGDFRAYPLHSAPIMRGFNVSGNIKGAPLRPFGHFVQARVEAGYDRSR